MSHFQDRNTSRSESERDEGRGALSTAAPENEREPKAQSSNDLPSSAPDLATSQKSGSPVGSDARDTNRGDQIELFDNPQDYERRWADIQSGFVDEPRRAVEQADKLVDEVIRSLAETFSSERLRLEHQWSSGDDVSTDDLRMALQRYRSFFHRLLTR